MEIYRVCRLCFSRENSAPFTSLFGDDGKLQSIFEICTAISVIQEFCNFFKIFNKFDVLQLYNDRVTNTPALICPNCLIRLNDVYVLQTKAREIEINIQFMKRTSNIQPIVTQQPANFTKTQPTHVKQAEIPKTPSKVMNVYLFLMSLD